MVGREYISQRIRSAMSQLFFKSNAEGAEMVKVECGDFKLSFNDCEKVEQLSYGLSELRARTISIPITFHGYGRAVAALFGRLEYYERLRRQHKAKGRGKNWRVVR